DAPAGTMHLLGLVFLLILMPWLNFYKNVRGLLRINQLGLPLFGWPQEFWYLLVGVLISLVLFVAILLYRRGKLTILPGTSLGRAQMLLLFLLWISVLAAFLQAMPHMHRTGTLWVHVTFWITACLVTLLILLAPLYPLVTKESAPGPAASTWPPGLGMILLFLLIPCLIGLLTYGITAMHEGPLPGSQLRW
ncbi:MAG TPA: hypothetical protein PKA06_13295, partial [Gemmatales bacterium]|nr:hypothetical protein [Gemmatales bacterium]